MLIKSFKSNSAGTDIDVVYDLYNVDGTLKTANATMSLTEFKSKYPDMYGYLVTKFVYDANGNIIRGTFSGEYKVYETDDFFEILRRGLMAKCAVMRKYTFLSLFSINSYFETEPDIQSFIQPDVQDAAQTTLELLLSILNLDFIRKDIEFTSIYKEILYASDGMLKYWYRTGNYDVTAFEQEYLEMINHWETVYGKGTENDGKQL